MSTLSGTPLVTDAPTPLPGSLASAPRMKAAGRTWKLLVLLAIYVLVAHVLPAPTGVQPPGWRVTAVFLATMTGLILQPVSGAAMVVVGLTLLAALGGVPLTRVLSGYSAASVWLVLAAMLMSRVLRDTGLARRIALLFVRAFGRSSLGVSYALAMADVTLAVGVPSITARSAGIMLPITRDIAEVYDSRPGLTAPVLGTFLMTGLYQVSLVSCAMFFTGQASNVLAASLAAKVAGVQMTWASWLIAGLVPGLASVLVIPYVVYRLVPPTLKRTPDAAEYARRQIAQMGPLGREETTVFVIFSVVCLLWMTTSWHHLEVTFVTLCGLSALLLTNVLSWESALAERSAWDVFVWYGGLLTMGDVLNETGSTTAFATAVGALFANVPWFTVLVATILIYFYVHYVFASITTHVLSMFPPFALMLISLGTPPALVVYSLACLVNLAAGLTHYGTTTAPIVFTEGYVSVRDWWRVGFVASIVNLSIWLTIGFAWWKVLGFW